MLGGRRLEPNAVAKGVSVSWMVEKDKQVTLAFIDAGQRQASLTSTDGASG
jgi:hypothetical protein